MAGFLFPGQGSQAPGMGKFLFDNFKIAKEIFEEASDALSLNLKKLCFDGSESDLALTENTQPCLLTVSTATAKVLNHDFSFKAKIAAGHSIGEYAALVATQSLNFADAIRSVRTRGIEMQKAVSPGQGGMCAVLGLEDSLIEELCLLTIKHSGFSPLSAANYNCPGQVVISGSMNTITWLKTNLKSDFFRPELQKAKLIPLQVSAPFHCSLMKPAEEVMRTVLNEINFSNAQFPIVQNLTSKPETQADLLRENLIHQVSAPVLWAQSISNILETGEKIFIEAGHGRVLAGLNRKISNEIQTFSTNSLDDLKIIESKLKDKTL